MQGRSHRGFEQTLHLHKQAVGCRNNQSRGNTPTGLGSPGLRGSSPQAGNGQPAQPSAKGKAGNGDRRSPRVKLKSLLGDSPLQHNPTALSNLKPPEKQGSGTRQAANPSRLAPEGPEAMASALGNSLHAVTAAAEMRGGDAAEAQGVEEKGSGPRRALPQRLEERLNEAASPQQGVAMSGGTQAPVGPPVAKAEQQGDSGVGPVEPPPDGSAEPRTRTEKGDAPGCAPANLNQ